MNIFKASGIGLAIALAFVGVVTTLPGISAQASVGPGTSASSTNAQQPAATPGIVLLCTDCKTGSAEASVSRATQTATDIQPGTPAASTHSDAPATLVALAPLAASIGGGAGYAEGDAGSVAEGSGSGANSGWGPYWGRMGRDTSGTAGQGESGAPVSNSGTGGLEVPSSTPGGKTQSSSDSGTPPDGTQAAIPSQTAPILVSCSVPLCDTDRSVEPQRPTQPTASLPDTYPAAPSQSEPDMLIPDIALQPEPLPDTPALVPIEPTELTDAPRSVPEPVTAALMGVGFAVFRLAFRRRNKRLT
jgi:hypothetical protein